MLLALLSHTVYFMNASDRFLEQALEELEVLRAENEVLKQKLSKARSLFKKIKKLLEIRNEKK